MQCVSSILDVLSRLVVVSFIPRIIENVYEGLFMCVLQSSLSDKGLLSYISQIHLTNAHYKLLNYIIHSVGISIAIMYTAL